MRGWLALLGVVAAVVAVGVALLLVVVGSDATSVVDLEVGDCFDFPTVDGDDVAEFETVDVVSCSEPHEAEVVFVGDLNPDGDTPYPDDIDLFALADRRCGTGVELPDELADRFGVVPIAPTQETWEGADGRFSCVALQYGGDRFDFSVLAPDSWVSNGG
jgi:hypothetical protein